ncbi:hypothetical protein GGI12_005220 [Dipsacomyces acuminosporus]|nr:hypothetical protein GGI12_005220 [Dipsacomyces acuminosporus]
MKAQLAAFDNGVASGVINISDDDEDDVVVVDQKPAGKGNGSVLHETAKRRMQPEGLPFPDGIVRLTTLQGQKYTKDETFSLKDIVQPDILRKALLTTMVLELDWLTSHFKSSTKLVIAESYDPNTQPGGVLQTNDQNITIIHPKFPRQRYPMMHSKIMLLFYDNYIRFVVSSANLIEIDWTIMHNIVFIQDVPFDPKKKFRQNEFSKSLVESLYDLNVPRQVVLQLESADFSNVKAHIVTSVPSALGAQHLQSENYGILRLSEVIQSIKEQQHESDTDLEDVHLYCYGSSMGSINREYLDRFFRCAIGLPPTAPASSTSESRSSATPNLKIGFHTDAQGSSCIYGPVARSCVKFNPKFYFSDAYPKNQLFKVQPKYENTLVHAKIVMARCGEKRDRGWMYIGSHNFTPGAWGRVYKTGSFSVNNYEYGVVLPDVKFETAFGHDSVTWNGSKIPLPFKLDWKPYSEGELPLLSPASY